MPAHGCPPGRERLCPPTLWVPFQGCQSGGAAAARYLRVFFDLQNAMQFIAKRSPGPRWALQGHREGLHPGNIWPPDFHRGPEGRATRRPDTCRGDAKPDSTTAARSARAVPIPTSAATLPKRPRARSRCGVHPMRWAMRQGLRHSRLPRHGADFQPRGGATSATSATRGKPSERPSRAALSPPGAWPRCQPAPRSHQTTSPPP